MFRVEEEGGRVFVTSMRLLGGGSVEFWEGGGVLIVHFSIKIINKISNQLIYK